MNQMDYRKTNGEMTKYQEGTGKADINCHLWSGKVKDLEVRGEGKESKLRKWL